MKRIWVSLFLAAATALADTESPLPLWDAPNWITAIEEAWITNGSLLSDDLVPQFNPGAEVTLQVDQPTTEELAGSPESGNEFSGEFVEPYFARRPNSYLVDSQSLLSEEGRNELEEILNYHSGESSIDIFVYIFGTGQKIPGDVREEEVAERLFSVGKSALVIYYYLGEAQRSTIYLSPLLISKVTIAEQRRALESSVMQALQSTEPYNQIKGFLVEMSMRAYWMERMADGTARQTVDGRVEGRRAKILPTVDPPKIALTIIPKRARVAAYVFAAALGALIAIWSLVAWWLSRVKYLFPEIEVEPRLGGSHAAGVGAVISFASPAIPPAMQRNQLPDYMRRA